MTIPTTPEEQASRLNVIRRQLVDLQPVRQELLTDLRACERQIEALCKEKHLIEFAQIKIKICNPGASGYKRIVPGAKPLDTMKAVRGLDPAQSAALLTQLLRMQREMEHEELELEVEIVVPEDDDHPPMEPYCEEDEEEDADETNDN